MSIRELANALLRGDQLSWSDDDDDHRQPEVTCSQDAKVPLPVPDYLLTNNPAGVVCEPPVRMNIVII